MYKFCSSRAFYHRYLSISTSLCNTHSRADDLESLGYVLLQFYCTNLPWSGLQSSSQRLLEEKILERKMATNIDDLYGGFNRLAEYITHCRLKLVLDLCKLLQLKLKDNFPF